MRDLIRRDLAAQSVSVTREAILPGYRDVAEGAVFTSSGGFASDDMAILA